MAFGQKYSNEFLAIGVGARAHGMSGAQTAITNDLSAAYWNPAGLTSIEAPFQVNAMHAEWFAGVGQYDYLGFGKSLNKEKKSFEEFFSGVLNEREAIQKPFLVVNLLNEYDLIIYVKGGGISSQIEAIRLAISKAICKINQEYRPILKQNLYLRRDARIKERRKYGLKKARKASQYSKR